MDSRVQSMWEEMNKGVPNTHRTVTEKSCSTVNKSPEKLSNNWVTYLGLETSQGKEKKVSSDIDNGIASLWEQMNKGVPNNRLKTFSNIPHATGTSENMSDLNWKMYLGLEPNRTGSSGMDTSQQEPTSLQNGACESSKRLASVALAAVKDAATAAGKGKVEITEVRDFAGKEIEIKKLVDADSKEASEKTKASVPSAVDVILEQIKKKQKLSVLDKSKKDWGEFKGEHKGLEDELDAYKKSSNQYLDRVNFLERADYREFERERDARLAQHSRKRPDMREDP